jgi:hypothetical protein
MAKLGRGITSGLPWIKITSDDLARLQKVGKRQLADADAEKLEEIVNRYVQMKAMEESHPDSKKADDYLKTLQNPAKKLIKNIEAARIEITAVEAPDKDLAGRYFALQDVFFAKADCENAKEGEAQFLNQLRLFNLACEKAREAVQDAKLSSVRRPDVWFISLFDDAGRVYEAAGGTPTAYWSNHDSGDEKCAPRHAPGHDGSAFTDFVHELLSLCPKKYRPTSKKALGTRPCTHKQELSFSSGTMSEIHPKAAVISKRSARRKCASFRRLTTTHASNSLSDIIRTTRVPHVSRRPML